MTLRHERHSSDLILYVETVNYKFQPCLIQYTIIILWALLRGGSKLILSSNRYFIHPDSTVFFPSMTNTWTNGRTDCVHIAVYLQNQDVQILWIHERYDTCWELVSWSIGKTKHAGKDLGLSWMNILTDCCAGDYILPFTLLFAASYDEHYSHCLNRVNTWAWTYTLKILI